MKELRGTESTRKSIQKLKCGEQRNSANCVDVDACSTNSSSDSKQTRRPLYLFISHRGVQFTDINTQVTFFYSAQSKNKKPNNYLL